MSVHLPTGTVTLLLGDVEGSTRLWERRAEAMTAAVEQLYEAVSHVTTAHDGVRPVEQGEGVSFVIAFSRASGAVAAALDLQRAQLAPIRLRIGVHTGEVLLRDDGNYAGPTINRAARLRDLAHGGQTLLSGAVEHLVVDDLPDGAWLTNLGTHQLRDLPRPERVVQLCHPDLRLEFPPLTTSNCHVTHGLPVQLTNFVGRCAQITEVRQLATGNRLVTLTGVGGVGKTRLAVQVATQLAGELDGAWYVDLAPIRDPDLVPITVARALGLRDQPGRSTVDVVLRFLSARRALVVLDNCEHLLDATAALVSAVLAACLHMRVLATSREPLRVAGEVNWRVPSLSLSDEAVELFCDRARRVRPDFRLTDANSEAVMELCRSLDGLPLAIELAAARVRALSPAEIVDGLDERFQLLTGGARITTRRQQTLWASVDWSHALLTGPERILFRRLAVFVGCFWLDDAQAVAGGGDIERYQILDELTLLVDKSLVVADDSRGRMCYRLLETGRQYALEKLDESGEVDVVQLRYRDHYVMLAALLEASDYTDYAQRIERAETQIDNFRAAFVWSRANSETELALALASSLQPVWLTRGRIREGRAWFDTVLTGDDASRRELAAGVRARALADKALLDIFVDAAAGIDHAQQALAIARDVDDRALLARVLTACGFISVMVRAEVAAPYFAEAIGLARELNDQWRLSQILTFQALEAVSTGFPLVARAAAAEGLELANTVGDQSISLWSRCCLGFAQWMRGDLAAAIEQLGEVVDEAEAADEVMHRASSLHGLAYACAYQGQISEARAAAETALEATELGEYFAGMGYSALAVAALAAGDVETAHDAGEAAWQNLALAAPHQAAIQRAFNSQIALAAGDLIEARGWCDDAMETTSGRYLVMALITRARIGIAEGDREQAQRDAQNALAHLAKNESYLDLPDVLECLAGLASDTDNHKYAAMLVGAAGATRQRIGLARFVVHEPAYEASVATLRDAMGETDFEAARIEGAALSISEAIDYGQHDLGRHKRPDSGWGALTPAELDVVRLVCEGLSNKDVASRLFVSHRTVQTHLTRVYGKLGITSRVQLAQQAAGRVCGRE
ncbi:Putative HTH-type transcriptional regulator [Mycobacterium simulans]|uniref:helix-turn-helix transcriptional regulator n=1 Tax=Mycobacterium simulans TaxID=627089 RepID=UPI00174C098B|nr:LuxR C-terminal-related transcriptional regulator [Mycobacterium simulans]SON63567.1 Putative HTH-type transcriptional regulator [Mycobacterium simulans]